MKDNSKNLRITLRQLLNVYIYHEFRLYQENFFDLWIDYIYVGASPFLNGELNKYLDCVVDGVVPNDHFLTIYIKGKDF